MTAFAAEKVKEPFANLEVVTDKETINEIVSENPRIQKYLDQNEVFADLEIITDQNEIEKIWEENPDVKTLMKSKEYLPLLMPWSFRLVPLISIWHFH